MKRKLGLLAAVATVLTLAACSTNQLGPTRSGGSQPSASQPGSSQENTFVITIESDPPHFNMGITTDGAAQYSSRSMFEPLVNLTDDFEVVPGLATEWSANDDYSQFTFKLRKGVTWHDGKPFTSKDVAFYFDEVIPTHPLAADIAAIYDSTETPDDYTAIVKLTKPYGPFFPAMTPHYLLPAHLFSGTDIATNPANLNPVGTGPFKFVSYTPGDSVVVTKSDSYWGPQGDVDRIVYKVMTDGNSRATAFQGGEVDLALKLPIINKLQLKSDPRFTFDFAVMPEHLYLFINTRTDKHLQDPKVRTALYRAIDRAEISEKIYYGTAEPSKSIMPNQQLKATLTAADDYSQAFSFNIDEANRLLDEAGATRGADGKRFTVRLNFRNANPTWAGVAELIKASFEQIGIGVDLISQETTVYTDTVFAQEDFDLTLLQLGAFADPSLGTSRAYLCNPKKTAYRNPTGLCDDQLTHSLNDAATHGDPKVRSQDFLRAAQRNAKLLASIPLVSIQQIEAFRTDRWDGIDAFEGWEKWDWSALKRKA